MNIHARTKLMALIGAVALTMMSGSADAAGLVGSTLSLGFYVSGDFVVDALGNSIDPSGDPNVLHPIDQFYDDVLVTDGASFTFSDPAVGKGDRRSLHARHVHQHRRDLHQSRLQNPLADPRGARLAA